MTGAQRREDSKEAPARRSAHRASLLVAVSERPTFEARGLKVAEATGTLPF